MASTKKTPATAAKAEKIVAAPEVKNEKKAEAVTASAAPEVKATAAAPEKKPAEKKAATAKKVAAKAEKAAKKPAAKAAKPAAKTAEKAAPAKKAAPKKKKEITAETVCEKITKRLNAKAAAEIEGKIAVDVKLYGAFEAHMYIEVKDGVLTVAPFDYIDKNVEAAIEVADALAIADGKLTIADALATGKLYAFGNLAVAAKLAKLF